MPLRRSHLRVHKRELARRTKPRMRRERRRKALHLQRDEVLIQQERSSSRAVLGELPGHREVRGRDAVFVETKPEGGFSVKAASIEKAITPKTRLLVLNSPGIPRAASFPGRVRAYPGGLQESTTSG